MHPNDFDKSLVADSSLHPPIHGDEGTSGAMPGSVLLAVTASIDERINDTTARSKTRNGHRIQVTFWPAHPPAVSYFSVCSPDLKPDDFAREPVVVATEDDLVLLRVVLGPQSAIFEPDRFEYFVYQAGGGAPSLQLLKHPGPSRSFADSYVGLLRCRPKRVDDDGDFFIIAALCYTMVPGQYDLHIFDSRTKDWDTKKTLLREQQERGEHSLHVNSNVIVVGGQAGTMGWVDLWRGIIFCDVLLNDPMLRYIELPPPLNPNRKFQGCPRSARDIAVIEGRIKYVELQIHMKPDSVIIGNHIANGWTAIIWSRNATNPFEEDNWQQDCRVRSSEISPENNSMQFELLHKLLEDQDMPQLTLERLYTGHPTLSLHDDNIVYLMTKIDYRNTTAWVLAVDMRSRALCGVAKFSAQRTLGMSFAYMCSGICRHLHIAPGTTDNLKLSGMLIPGSLIKKQFGGPSICWPRLG